jgi:hypothetical protein
MPRYQPKYCEENVWHLLDDELAGTQQAWAVFVSNVDRLCMMWSQRAAREPHAFVAWDYHVVALAFDDGEYTLWDLDTTIEMPSSVAEWLDATFPHGFQTKYGPTFRIVERSKFLETFSSDRSHMLDANGNWRAQPPEWEPIFDPERGMNLHDFVDMSPGEAETLPGERLHAGEFRTRFTSNDD